MDELQRYLSQIRVMRSVLSFTNPFGGEDQHVNDLIKKIEENLKELEDYIEDDLLERGAENPKKGVEKSSIPLKT